MTGIKSAREAVGRGDLARVRSSIAAEPHLARDWRLVLDAALYRRAEVIEALLECGADPNAVSRSEAKYRPLHRAIEPKPSLKDRGELGAVLTVLLSAGADPEASGCWYEGRALETAARAGDHVTAAELVVRGVAYDTVAAALVGDAAWLLKDLRRDPGSAVRLDEGGVEPLHRLCASKLNRHCVVEIAKALIAAGASAKARTRMKHAQLPVLHFACFGGDAHPDLLRVLVSAGASPDEGLYEALWSGDFSGAQTLLELGASADSWSHVSARPMLSEMIQWGRNRAAIWLLEKGANPNQRDSSGRTPLDLAQSRGAPSAVTDALLQAGAKPD